MYSFRVTLRGILGKLNISASAVSIITTSMKARRSLSHNDRSTASSIYPLYVSLFLSTAFTSSSPKRASSSSLYLSSTASAEAPSSNLRKLFRTNVPIVSRSSFQKTDLSSRVSRKCSLLNTMRRMILRHSSQSSFGVSTGLSI